MNKQQKATLAVATIGAIATFFPWIVFSAGAFGYSVSESIDGFNGSGVLYLFVMLGAGVWAVIGKQFEAVQVQQVDNPDAWRDKCIFNNNILQQ